MKITSRKATEMTGECDMTPMIDMTFQLIIFLMLMVNFSAVDQNAAVQLPVSELAKPPDKPLEKPITLNVLKNGTIIAGGRTVPVEGLRGLLSQEADAILAEGKEVADANIIIRGHGEVAVGTVQDIIKICQEAHFEKFALRAKESE
ncbi:MAG TPA: biopolymer transporter ExbD [Pirellulaceae bacterium]|nr:biopolymer transporter ExbD [Pirellulaceae bacterium]